MQNFTEKVLRGVMAPPIEMLTKDGFDLQWGTNVVGPYLFTKSLIPALLAGVATSSDGHARVITTSSSVAYLETLHWDTFKDGLARRKMSPTALYHQSKLVRGLTRYKSDCTHADPAGI